MHGDARTILVVRSAPENLPQVCERFRVAARVDTPWSRGFENHRLIGVCERPRVRLRDRWAENRTFS